MSVVIDYFRSGGTTTINTTGGGANTTAISRINRTIGAGEDEIGSDVVYLNSAYNMLINNVLDVELYENGILNTTAVITKTQNDIYDSAYSSQPIKIVVFTCTGLTTPVDIGDAFLLKIMLRNPLPL